MAVTKLILLPRKQQRTRMGYDLELEDMIQDQEKNEVEKNDHKKD